MGHHPRGIAADAEDNHFGVTSLPAGHEMLGVGAEVDAVDESAVVGEMSPLLDVGGAVEPDFPLLCSDGILSVGSKPAGKDGMPQDNFCQGSPPRNRVYLVAVVSANYQLVGLLVEVYLLHHGVGHVQSLQGGVRRVVGSIADSYRPVVNPPGHVELIGRKLCRLGGASGTEAKGWGAGLHRVNALIVILGSHHEVVSVGGEVDLVDVVGSGEGAVGDPLAQDGSHECGRQYELE